MHVYFFQFFLLWSRIKLQTKIRKVKTTIKYNNHDHFYSPVSCLNMLKEFGIEVPL